MPPYPHPFDTSYGEDCYKKSDQQEAGYDRKLQLASLLPLEKQLLPNPTCFSAPLGGCVR